MQVTISNTITIRAPSTEILDWCNTNLKIANPDYAKKIRMHLWLGNTPQYLFLYEMRCGDLILPFGTLRQILPMLGEADIHSEFTDPVKVEYHGQVPLYDYQEKAVDAVIPQFYGILQSPAGSGKTQMGIALIDKMSVRALWLTHTKDLLDQSKARAELYIDDSLLGTITEGKVNIGKGITFATIQTMCRLNLSEYKDFWDLIIVDECHRCAGSPADMTQFFRVLNSLAARSKYGLSATVHRSDGMIAATYALLGEVVYAVPKEEVKDKIMRVGIKTISTETVLTQGCINTDGTLSYTGLISHLCEDKQRNQLIASKIIENAGAPSLILSDRLLHLETLMNLLPDNMRADAIMISGKMTTKKGKAERKQAISDMQSGNKKYLFATYALAKEGLDVPCLERLYMGTPQKDYVVITQSIGRIARTHPGKRDPICYDFVDNIRYLFRCYKKRCAIYKKNDCYYVEEINAES